MRQMAFGDFVFDFQQHLLLRRGDPVDLGSRTYRLLECLLRRRGEVLHKAELVGAAWGDQAVEESNLSVQMAVLRRILGKDTAGREWITTIERVGYRFRPELARTERPERPGLPMVEVGLSTDGAGSEAIAETETDDVIAGLSLLSSLHAGRRGEVTKRPSYRLAGNVVTSNNARQVRVRLVDGITDQVIWAETFFPADSGKGALAGIVANVEERVHLAETRRSALERPNSDAPHDLYLQARALIRGSRHEDNARALALLLKALDVEPDNPRYLAAAAETLHTRRLCGWPDLTGHDQELRLGFAKRAWEASENDADSLSLAGNAMFTSGEPELGLALTELAAEMNPYSPSVLGCAGHSHLWLGEIEDARRYHERAIALSPNSKSARFAYSSLASILNISGRHEEALATAQRGRAISPAYSGLHWQTMVANLALGREAAASQGLSAYRQLHPHARLGSIKNSQPFRIERRVRPLLETLGQLGLPES